MIILNEELKPFLKNTSFKNIMALKGDVFRAVPGRLTQRIQLGNGFYFIKQHKGVGLKEIIKNLLQLRLPVLSAKNEWRALQQLKALNVDVPEIAGFGSSGSNPARMQSFLITKALPSHISLEDLCRPWQKNPPSFMLKQRLIEKVADIARTLHENGINHRDFYICHFLLDVTCDSVIKDPSAIKLYLIDLHRAHIRSITPTRWKIKDLAGLYFSSKEIGLTKKDLLRFIKKYRNKSLHEIVNKESHFWLKVKKRGDKLYRKHEK